MLSLESPIFQHDIASVGTLSEKHSVYLLTGSTRGEQLAIKGERGGVRQAMKWNYKVMSYVDTTARQVALRREEKTALLAWAQSAQEALKEGADPALGSFLWDLSRSTPDLVDCVVSNRQFLTAVHALAFIQEGNVRRAVDYKNLGAEELGSVYESLLELHPIVNADAGHVPV